MDWITRMQIIASHVIGLDVGLLMYEPLTDFVKLAFVHINQCTNERWEKKDSVDYEHLQAVE